MAASIPSTNRGRVFRIAVPLLAFLMLATGLALQTPWQHSTYVRVDLKALGYFLFDQRLGTINEVPARWRALDGKRVQLEGFMWAPTASGRGVSEFQLVYEIYKSSGFGPPLVQERVFAKSASPVPYLDDLADVSGTLHVNVKHDPDGDVTAVYELDVDKVKLAGGGEIVQPARIAIGDDLAWIGSILLIACGFIELLRPIRRSYCIKPDHLCPVCGYDVRASPQRCPECGTPTGRVPNSVRTPQA